MKPFTEKAIVVMKNIPSGKVMTYGQIAEIAGNKRGARQVVRLLHSMSKKENLPWHRVINAKGEIGLTDEEGRFTQKEMLKAEGIHLMKNGKIDLLIYRYQPEKEEDNC
ncbi:MAG: MGMT family protein [Carnobacterium sp.]|nr:MGMT family protein [Carnobacterium sp.]